MRAIIICGAFAAITITGCTHSSGVMKMGPDTYSVSSRAAPAAGGTAGARGIALSEANAHCASQGREILVTDTSTAPDRSFPGGMAYVTFRCLDKADPELRRPVYERVPDTVIEDRRSR